MRYIALNNNVYEIPEWFYQKRFIGKLPRKGKILIFKSREEEKRHQKLCDNIRKNFKPAFELSSLLRDD